MNPRIVLGIFFILILSNIFAASEIINPEKSESNSLEVLQVEEIDALGINNYQDVFYPPEEVLLKEMGITTEQYKQLLRNNASKNRNSGVSNLWGTAPLSGTIKIPVLLVKFSDRNSSLTSWTDINNAFNSNNYSIPGYSGISVSKYYTKQSYGDLNIIFDVYDWREAPHPFSYYADNAATEFQLAIHSMNLFDPYVDFTQYDYNNDERLDGVILIYPGVGVNSSIGIWPQTRILKQYNSNPVDGKYLGNVAFVPEKSTQSDFNNFSIELATHEFAHILGLFDLYSITNGAPSNGPMNGVTMMNNSISESNRGYCFINPINLDVWSRYFLDWIHNPIELTIDSNKEISLRSINDYPDAVILRNNNMSEQEYFIVENRYRNINDPNNLDACMFLRGDSTYGGFGIYHVDETKISEKYNDLYNNPQSDSDLNICSDILSHSGITFEQNNVERCNLAQYSSNSTNKDLYFYNPPSGTCNLSLFDGNAHKCPYYSATFDFTSISYDGLNTNIKLETNSLPNSYTMTAKMLVGQETVVPIIETIAGIYSENTPIIISAPSDTNIYYTIDGNTPTTSSTQYFDPITNLPVGNITLKAIAKKPDSYVSDVASVNYTITGTVADPVASQPPGNVAYNSQVTLSTITESATIRYTLDGTEPNESSLVYSNSNPIVIDQNLTLKAKAYKAGYAASAIVEFNYTVQIAEPPEASPSPGVVNYNSEIVLSTTRTETIIRYTLDNSEPDESSTIYENPIIITDDTILKAKSYRDGFAPSTTADFNYTVQKVTTPTASQPNGNVNYLSQVTLSTTTTDATIRYTLDGLPPNESSLVYSSPLIIDSNKTIKVIAYKDGFAPSGTITFNYTIQTVMTPTSSSPPGFIDYGSQVALSTTTPGAVIRYTINGSNPTIGSAIYHFPISIGSYLNLKARAYKDGFAPSPVASYIYRAGVTTPRADIHGGNYESPIEVVLKTSTNRAVIKYTLDGTDPTFATGLTYTFPNPIPISSTTTLKAKAYIYSQRPQVVAYDTAEAVKPIRLESELLTEHYVFPE
ncbi:MAG: chitobiase/beta-hexosaminidase C-terminal domain-containing protein [archaeon]